MDSVGRDWLGASNHVHVLFEHDVGSAVALFTRLEPDDYVTL